jgi:long-chain acyl-CoA synthetase
MSKVKTLKPGYYGEGSYEVSPPAGPGEGGVRRCTLAKDGLVERPLEGINTVYDIVDYAARTHGSKKALGWREVVKIVEEEKEVTKVVEGKEVKEKKVWKYFELSDYKFHSYIEVKEIVSEIARALVHLGVSDKDIFNVYAQTR